MPSRDFLPIQADVLEEIGPRIGLPESDDLQPWFSGRPVRLVWDLSGYEVQNGVLRRVPDPVQFQEPAPNTLIGDAVSINLAEGDSEETELVEPVSREGEAINLQWATLRVSEANVISQPEYGFFAALRHVTQGDISTNVWRASSESDLISTTGGVVFNVDLTPISFEDGGFKFFILNEGTSSGAIEYSFQLFYDIS